MKSLRETAENIILENNYVSLTISKRDGQVKKIVSDNIDILDENTYFFYLIDTNDKIVVPESLKLEKDIIKVETKIGNYHIKTEVCVK